MTPGNVHSPELQNLETGKTLELLRLRVPDGEFQEKALQRVGSRRIRQQQMKGKDIGLGKVQGDHGSTLVEIEIEDLDFAADSMFEPEVDKLGMPAP